MPALEALAPTGAVGADAERPRAGRAMPSADEAARGLEFLMVGMVAFAVETAAFAALVADDIDLARWAGAHGATAASVVAWFLLRRRDGTGRRMATLLMLSTVFMGPFGAGGTLIAALAHRWFRRSATPFEEWYKALFPAPDDRPARDLYDLIASGREVASSGSIASFYDVLAMGTTEQKRAVITLMTRFFRPNFAPALKQALADSEPAIRVQAATAVAEIENGFLERAVTLGKEAEGRPDDADRVFAMARHYDDYAFSGLLDPVRERDNRARALDAYLRCLDLDPKRLDARASVGRILLRDGKYHEAATVLGEGVVGGDATPAMLDYYIEALFRLGSYQRVREFIRDRGGEMLNDPKRPPELKLAIDLWAGKGRGL